MQWETFTLKISFKTLHDINALIYFQLFNVMFHHDIVSQVTTSRRRFLQADFGPLLLEFNEILRPRMSQNVSRHRHSAQTLMMEHRMLVAVRANAVTSVGFHHLRLFFRSFFGQFALFSPSVLEPNFDLAFREAEALGQLGFSADRNVSVVESELFFQLHALVVRVDDAVFVFRAGFAWNKTRIECYRDKGDVELARACHQVARVCQLQPFKQNFRFVGIKVLFQHHKCCWNFLFPGIFCFLESTHRNCLKILKFAFPTSSYFQKIRWRRF